jgi:hypothetical protein
VDIIEDPLPLVDLKVGVKVKQPQRVYLLSGEELAFKYDFGRVWIELEKMVGHELVVFEL